MDLSSLSIKMTHLRCAWVSPQTASSTFTQVQGYGKQWAGTGSQRPSECTAGIQKIYVKTEILIALPTSRESLGTSVFTPPSLEHWLCQSKWCLLQDPAADL